MGIEGLAAFVYKGRNRFLETVTLKDGSSLVFDGNNYFNQSNVPKRFGGDYASLYAHYEHDFKCLQRTGVTSYVILDGQRVVNTIKNQLTQEGRQGFISNIKYLDHDTKDRNKYPKPIFLRSVFLQVLQDMRIPHAVSDNEADTAVASVAKKLGCPVVSDDSDFLMLNLDHGVIRVSDLKQSLLKENTKCNVYYFTNMVRYLNIDPILTPFVSVILGNDYSKEDNLHLEIQNSIRAEDVKTINKKLKCITSYLRGRTKNFLMSDISRTINIKQDTIQSWCNRYDLELFREEAEVLYPLLFDTSTPQEKIQLLCTTSKSQMKQLVKGLCQYGLVCASIANLYFWDIHFNAVQCESVNQESSCQASKRLRNYMYALLKYERLCETERVVITEYRRNGEHYSKSTKEVKKVDWSDIPIDVLFLQCHREGEKNPGAEKKKEIILQLVQYPHENLKDVPQEHELFMLSLHYVILQQQERRRNNITWLHVKALLICYLSSYYSTAAADIRVESSDLMVDIDASHAFAECQSCLYYLDIINTLFFRPFQSLDYSAVFNGCFVHTIFKNLKEGFIDKDLVTDGSKKLYEKLENFLPRDLLER
ncbi:protein asteroid homolog 1-like [Hydractinia symbiolongicarpus]|uniref:protein asteroid homolog 1-like n=1 Tax=Hydractinia symbiolongicarpus TaxID=13093 RepID=UPI002551558A|nr:protein asteroid homolog 1-like [Hydractinia symbiolongicarpus]